MTRGVRLALVLAALLPPLATHHIVSRREVVRTFDLAGIPERLGELDFAGEDELPADVLEQISPDAHTLRLYAGEHGPSVWAYLAFYGGGDGKGAHDPEVCYPAQGWDVETLYSREVTLADGQSLTGKVLAADLGAQEELVLYWFQPAGRWPRRPPLELALRGFDALAGRSRYAFVRLSTRIASADAAQRSAAEARLLETARELAPAVRSAVDSI